MNSSVLCFSLSLIRRLHNRTVVIGNTSRRYNHLWSLWRQEVSHELHSHKIPLLVIQHKLSAAKDRKEVTGLLESINAKHQLYTLKESASLIKLISSRYKKHEEAASNNFSHSHTTDVSSSINSSIPLEELTLTVLDQLCYHISQHLYVITDPDQFLEISLIIAKSAYYHPLLTEEILQRLDYFLNLNQIQSPKQILASTSLLANLGIDLSTFGDTQNCDIATSTLRANILSFENGLNAFHGKSSSNSALPMYSMLRQNSSHPPLLIRPDKTQHDALINPENFTDRTCHLCQVALRSLTVKLSSYLFLKSVNFSGLVQLLRDLAWINCASPLVLPAIAYSLQKQLSKNHEISLNKIEQFVERCQSSSLDSSFEKEDESPKLLSSPNALISNTDAIDLLCCLEHLKAAKYSNIGQIVADIMASRLLNLSSTQFLLTIRHLSKCCIHPTLFIMELLRTDDLYLRLVKLYDANNITPDWSLKLLSALAALKFRHPTTLSVLLEKGIYPLLFSNELKQDRLLDKIHAIDTNVEQLNIMVELATALYKLDVWDENVFSYILKNISEALDRIELLSVVQLGNILLSFSYFCIGSSILMNHILEIVSSRIVGHLQDGLENFQYIGLICRIGYTPFLVEKELSKLSFEFLRRVESMEHPPVRTTDSIFQREIKEAANKLLFNVFESMSYGPLSFDLLIKMDGKDIARRLREEKQKGKKIPGRRTAPPIKEKLNYKKLYQKGTILLAWEPEHFYWGTKDLLSIFKLQRFLLSKLKLKFIELRSDVWNKIPTLDEKIEYLRPLLEVSADLLKDISVAHPPLDCHEALNHGIMITKTAPWTMKQPNEYHKELSPLMSQKQILQQISFIIKKKRERSHRISPTENIGLQNTVSQGLIERITRRTYREHKQQQIKIRLKKKELKETKEYISKST